MNKNVSFWLSGLDVHVEPPLKQNIDIDIAIIGGGFTGLNTAYNLYQMDKNLKIAIIEKDFVGFGASGRNAGFSMTLFGFTLEITALRFGKENAKHAHHYMVDAVQYVHDLIHQHKLDSDYEYPGFLRVAINDTYAKRIQKEIDFAHKLDLSGIYWINQEDVQKRVHSDIYKGAWWEPHCGLLNPAKHAIALKNLIKKYNIPIYENTPVLEIKKEKSNNKIVIKTPEAQIKADKVVITTNAYSFFYKPLKNKQTPIFTYVIITEPLKDDHFRSIGWKGREGIEDSRNFVHYYRLTKDNRILMGGRDIGLSYNYDLNKDHNESIFKKLKEDLIKTFPSLKNVKIDFTWGGPVSATLDFAPVIGFLGDKNIIYSFGCMGHGVSLTQYNGLTITELLLNQQTKRTEIFFVNRKIIPFPPEPLRFIVSHGIKTLLKIEDRWVDSIYK